MVPTHAKKKQGIDSIDILIGSDYYWDIVTGESIRGEFGPTAINSKFGWLLSGLTEEQHVHEISNVVSNLIISGKPLLNETNEVDEITDILKRSWDVESLGIVDTDREGELVKRKGEITFNSEQRKKGIVEIVPETEDQTLEEDKLSTRRIHYSPHHAVVRRDRETTKVRIVYDGSAKNCKNERSLNDCLEVGENYIPHIFKMLTRFRWNFVALTADIEKAFLMVGIKSEDRDMLRFLWFKDPFAKKLEINEYRFNRLVFGLRPSPSILCETIAHHLNLYKQSEPEMWKLLNKSLYVDDLLTGEENDENGFVVYQKSKKIMASGGFNLRKWNSNSQTLLKSIQACESSQEQTASVDPATAEDDESYAKSSITPGNYEMKNDTVVKVLGMNWDTIEDKFFFNLTELCDYGMSLPATKRSVLKLSAMHRVDEIHRFISKNEWRHCPGKQNPADLPSRGTSAKDLTINAIWWNGPEFLYQLEPEWPKNESTHFEDEEAPKETAKNAVNVTHSLVNSAANEPTTPKVDNAVQASSFDEEIKFLRDHRQNKCVPPTYVSQFGLFLENGIVKCKGRINKAELLGSAKNPILLPSKHEFVPLVIKKVHASVKHCGLRDTLTTIRERFWILRGPEAVKRVVKKCVICLRIDGMPYKSQSTPDLPVERVSEDPPFTHVGLDIAGPLNVVNEHANGSSKVYLCLFTCASTRAIHLELCRSLDVQEFQLAFRRFASRRGLPATITSDNAKTFKSSSKEVRRITRSNEVLRYFVNERISCNFIIERGPWWGGFWERLVKSVKTPPKKVLGRATLNFEQLRTLIVEIESVINARPITYVYDDTNSISYPLTPSDLVYGRRVTITPNSAHHEIISTHQSLTRRARHHKNLLQQVTTQWRKEYLTSLREQSNPRNKGNVAQEVSVGDLVLLKNDSTSRIHWKIAIVEELIPGADGKVRAAIVKVGNSDKRPTYLRRVIQHLIPIEVKSSINNDDTQSIADVSNQAVRPRRTAAVIGEISRQQMNVV
ncbi:hypothetical protein AWC38_SpisGene24559 [Stylophora pistillata]|uniref:Integrase catalytic domain-containing protein n=1 Tax=Stylophora pistillata TaxID=50429 RepID=A0A2B4R4A0_STYPI|nr:hypothetical protein AWC38_SpisGene24559 [Stylophora pistillata]